MAQIFNIDGDTINTATEEGLMSALQPAIATPKARQDTEATWSSIEVPANARFAHVSVETTNAFLVPVNTEPAEDGCSYKINGVYNIPVPSSSFLYFRRDGAVDGTISITFFSN